MSSKEENPLLNVGLLPTICRRVRTKNKVCKYTNTSKFLFFFLYLLVFKFNVRTVFFSVFRIRIGDSDGARDHNHL